MRDTSNEFPEPQPSDQGSTERLGGRWSERVGPVRLDWLVCGIVLSLYAAAQLWLLLGPHPFDPARYFQSAVRFPEAAADYWTLRIGLVAPVAVAVRALGPSEAALYAVPIATGLLLAGSVYWTMILLFRQRLVAACAALVTVLNPPFLLNSSSIFPDTTATATFTAGILGLGLAGSWGERDRSGRRASVAALAAGVLFGWTYLVRELSPVLLPAVVAAVVLFRVPLRRLLLGAASCLITVGLELVYGALVHGDPLVRAEVILDRADRPLGPARQAALERLNEQIDDPFAASLVLPRLFLGWDSGWILVGLLCVFLLGLVWIRNRRLWVFGAWFLTVCVVMALIGLFPLSSGEPIINSSNIRYWYPALPPLVMGAFGTVALLARGLLPMARGALAGAFAAVLVALAVIIPGTLEFRSCAAKDIWRNDPGERWDDLRGWLAGPEAARYDFLRTDGLTVRLVPAFQRTVFGDLLWPGRPLAAPGRAFLRPPSPGTLILVHKDRFVRARARAERRLLELGQSWRPLFVSEDGRMVILGPGGAGDAAPDDWADLFPTVNPAGAEAGECGLDPYLGR